MSCFLETYYSNLELNVSHGVVFNENKTVLADSLPNLSSYHHLLENMIKLV